MVRKIDSLLVSPEPQGASPFLATTALEEFWDTSRDIVFLGEWCKRYSRRSVWQSLHSQVMPSPWDSPGEVERSRRAVDSFYEEILSSLAKALEGLHKVEHSSRGWRIIVGSWLHNYISVIFDRYYCLQMARERYPDFSTWVWRSNQYLVPTNTRDFYYWAASDIYNLQLYGRILEEMGLTFPGRSYHLRTKNDHPRISSFRNGLKSAYGFLASWQEVLGKGHNIVLHATYFPRTVEWGLKFMLGDRCLISVPDQFSLSKKVFDEEGRKYVSSLLPRGLGFRDLIRKLIWRDLPYVLIENFHDVRKAAERHSFAPGATVLSAESWHLDEVFKHKAAMLLENGGRLVGIQHGGTYGVLNYVPHLNHEITISDRYYSWGWESGKANNNVIPFFAVKQVSQKIPELRRNRQTILYVGTTEPRYLSEFQTVPGKMKAYFEWQQNFLIALSVNVRRQMVARLVPEEFGWDYCARWSDIAPEIKMESLKRPLMISASRHRLCVIDYIGTPWLEILSANFPVILFWNFETADVTEDAARCLKNLHDEGILFYSPELAAKALEKIHTNVDGWWARSNLQKARKEFCDHYSRTAPDAFWKWKTEINQLASVGKSAIS